MDESPPNHVSGDIEAVSWHSVFQDPEWRARDWAKLMFFKVCGTDCLEPSFVVRVPCGEVANVIAVGVFEIAVRPLTFHPTAVPMRGDPLWRSIIQGRPVSSIGDGIVRVPPLSLPTVEHDIDRIHSVGLGPALAAFTRVLTR